MNAKQKRDLYQEVTDTVVDALDAGMIPWAQPWTGGRDGHRNPATGTIYRGVNPILLEVGAWRGGFSDHRWMTFKQAQAKKASVRKGERGTTIVFYKQIRVAANEADGGPASDDAKKTIWLLRHYTVFNVEQIDGLELDDEVEVFEPEETPEAEGILSGYFEREGAPKLSYGGDSAFYAPLSDSVRLPDRASFHDMPRFYSTAFHEAVHSTGHAKRLARKEVTDTVSFGSSAYGREELCAEMGAAMLCGLAGLDTITHSAGYIQHWRDAIAGDNRMVVFAAQRAQKAADHILGVTPGSERVREDA